MGLLFGKETDGGYVPSLWHRWCRPAVSGNVLNGLGETEVRRPTPAYHRQDRWHPWRLVQDMFYLRMALAGQFVTILRHHFLDRKPPAPVAAKKTPGTPDQWGKRIKDYATAIGVDKVGIVEIRQEWIFEGDRLPERFAIILATRMDYHALSKTVERRFRESVPEIMRIYYDGHRKARELADWLRGQGWAARGFGNPMGTALNILPAAIAAGIGELGKHGSLISREMGSLFRLAYVVTDLPLTTDAPVDFGVDDFCMRCQRCSTACPPQAIADHKQLVRGVERWYVDFDACVPYFNENYGCGICIAVCPWSQPGLADTITRKMLARRSQSGVTERHRASDGPAAPPVPLRSGKPLPRRPQAPEAAVHE